MLKQLELKIPPLLVLIIAMIVLYILPDISILAASTTALHYLHVAAIVLSVLALTIVLLAVLGFRQQHTTVDPTQPNKTEALVVNGIYRLSRNPMYLAFLLLLIAFGLWLNTLGIIPIAIAFIVYLTRWQIMPEESFLRQKFGADYEQYCRQVRRWL
ncbi:isoprenylcysteine carboxylmethyltransferase family protein [Thalassotalea sp. HSM 43]|uniref:methyltransferase family protein n=1 Tax=Thalassotalea sp. HSM 43 TaxID=2552945 RepID=UPI001080AC37|nr:isoprenylcysteine carboxylmethyltransferase family protein [Thalassotalea sp. HSM 43]QBY05006.1 isoprenylcysteine carboxylmethyltransferase family protein [Thalassotalea sp. HSM 43]